MSSNIKLLIALLLGAAIGALVMNRIGHNGPLANPSEEMEYGITSPISWDSAKIMVQHPLVDSLHKSSKLFTITSNNSKSALESWIVDKNVLLDFMGIRDGINYQPNVKAVRFYIAYNPSKSAEGYTLVAVPVDSQDNNIRRPKPVTSNGNFAQALEYHMPCPKNCGVRNHANELSKPEVQERRPQ